MAPRLLVAAAVAAVCVLFAVPATSAPSPRPLVTGIVDFDVFTGRAAPTGLRRTRALGASMVELPLVGRSVAPDTATRPAGFHASAPLDPAYRWGATDTAVKSAV